MLRAYVAPRPTTLSRGIHRVADALARYAPPDVTITDEMKDADLVLCHVIGPEGWPDYQAAFRRHGQRYAVFQYCFQTTTRPRVTGWRDFWERAAVVASYYDLATAWRLEQPGWTTLPNFVRTPLGVDTSVFYNERTLRRDHADCLVATSGYVAGTECVGEWGRVCDAQKAYQFHLGPALPELAQRHHARSGVGVTDRVLAAWYSDCRFVSGLRRSEGFELPAYEGLACGARPVMFAREDAYHWLSDHAEYIVEGDSASVIEQLEALVQRDYRPVTADEIRWVGREFELAADGGTVLGGGAPMKFTSFHGYLMHYGSVEALYEAALTGKIDHADVLAYFDHKTLLGYRQVQVLERIAEALEQLANPLLQGDKDGIVRAVVPAISTRCPECGALLQASVPHSPNCPIGKVQALRARHGG